MTEERRIRTWAQLDVLNGLDLEPFKGLQRSARNSCWWWALDVGPATAGGWSTERAPVEFGQPGAVGGHPGQAVEFVDGDPPQRAMVVGVHFAAGLGDEVGAQGCRRVELDVDAEAGADDHLDAEFLVQFAAERGGVGLADRHFSAWQLPQAGQFRRPNALGHEN